MSTRLDASELLNHMVCLQCHIAILEAAKLEAMARYEMIRERDDDHAIRSVPDEIALALHVSRGHVFNQLQLAHNLIERLPDTFSALRVGWIDAVKARALVEVTAELSVEHARVVEGKVLPKAGERTAGQIRASARYQRDRVDPAAAEARRQRAIEDRRVSFALFDDGVGELVATGSGDRLYLAWLVIDELARKIKVVGDERPIGAIRHDVHLDLILGKNVERVQVQAYLHVPATTLAGVGDDPGILAGYGPLTAERCREVAAGDAIWRRVFTDPVTGVVKDVDRRTYRPSDGLAEFIRVRDATCVAPGCQRPAHQCHLDHTVDWADGGCTCEYNLGALCLAHHRLKHLCGWTL